MAAIRSTKDSVCSGAQRQPFCGIDPKDGEQWGRESMPTTRELTLVRAIQKADRWKGLLHLSKAFGTRSAENKEQCESFVERHDFGYVSRTTTQRDGHVYFPEIPPAKE